MHSRKLSSAFGIKVPASAPLCLATSVPGFTASTSRTVPTCSCPTTGALGLLSATRSTMLQSPGPLTGLSYPPPPPPDIVDRLRLQCVHGQRGTNRDAHEPSHRLPHQVVQDR